MTRDDAHNEYFTWLYNLVCENRYSDQISYKKLLMHLHNTPFRYSILRDENRASDSVDLRDRFDPVIAETYLNDPCSVLEMMIALAIRCEENYMDDPVMGNRTNQWFWEMIVNLGLGSMDDSRYDKRYVTNCIDRLLDREYEPDGQGGLFKVKHYDRDLREVEIWVQFSWYLDEML